MSLVFTGDPAEALRKLAISPIFLVYLPTMIIQWLIFALIYLTVYRENVGMDSVGFTKFRFIYIPWAIAFFLASNLILTFLAVFLETIGLGIPGEIGLILPSDNTERAIWVVLSMTAGICEETAFRGYLITRLQIFGKTKSWIVPTLVASIAFGSGHAYQGAGGFILITIYGAMFAALYWRTGSLWPCIIAHFFQDFSALFYPTQY